jgi:putative hemolysin
MATANASTFRLSPLLSQFVPSAVASLLAPTLETMLSLRKLKRFYDALPTTTSPLQFANGALERLDVRFIVEGEVAALAGSGPLVVVANHPFGGIEGLYLYALLSSHRTDVRLLGNQLLGRVPEFAPTLFTVDVLGGRAVAPRNAIALRRAIHWVEGGGALIVFPAGEVAALDPLSRTVVDPPWHPSVARLVNLTHAPVVPVYFDGGNSPLFHAAGFVHPRFRTALLPREFLNKRRRTIAVRVGRPIPSRQLESLDGDGPLTEHLRLLVYSLASECQRPGAPTWQAQTARAPAPEPLAAPVVAPELSAEIAALAPAARLAVHGDLEVWCTDAASSPCVMREIGRVRELTFRAAGEGVGRARDLDPFDRYYDQLFAWNRATQEIVGGYRIGRVDQIRARFGNRGLYTSTLFRFRRALVPSLGAALELGRSFVRPEYQKNFTPLLLLWKGIAAYVLRHLEYRVLFGPVSISNDYTLASRELLTGFLRSRHGDVARVRLARPRHSLPTGERARLVRREAAQVGTLEALESVLTSIEPDGKGVPVLLRQYLKLGAQAIAFNVDPAFRNSIDVLVAVDLLNTDQKVLVKYMGRDGAERYLAHHRRRVPVEFRQQQSDDSQGPRRLSGRGATRGVIRS